MPSKEFWNHTSDPATCATCDKKLCAKEEVIVPLVSAFLVRIVSENDQRMANGLEDTVITSYHASVNPDIDLNDYIERIHSFSGASPCTYLVSMIYLDRALRKIPGFLVSSFTVHRLFLTCIMLASKFLDDVYFSNLHWSRVGGLKLKELNALEIETLFVLNFNMTVSPLEYSQYRTALLSCSVNGSLPDPLVPFREKQEDPSHLQLCAGIAA
eukprot:CAMPEP_0114560804 /NCGR_PEP_ID=MMETSP0114-20121206/11655_1 /TAXON_ID=31324 /ORGANISM="Goniomonas sp, Strain m" /LENGTH=212 /DNA_ID=CAMNT_0001746375 /DNA_START=19 /DNA_END=657 /DNA_ORIENTATION=+